MRPSREARGETRSQVDCRHFAVDALDHAGVGVTHHGREIGGLHAAASEPLGVGASEVVRREATDLRARARGREVATEVRLRAEEEDAAAVGVEHRELKEKRVTEVHDRHDALAVRPLLGVFRAADAHAPALEVHVFGARAEDGSPLR